MLNKNCLNCNCSIRVYPSSIKRGGGKFCSLSCQISYRNKYQFNPSHFRDVNGTKNPMYGKGHKIAGANNGMYGRKREQCPAWKGGVHVRKDGYIRVTIKSNLKEERMLQHRYLIEKHLGRKLRKDEVIHHKDFNKGHNDISNLQIMSRSEHSRLHKLYALGTI